MDSKKINAEIQKHYKAIKVAAKAARADKGSKAAKRKAAAKAARADRGSAKKSAAAKKAAKKSAAAKRAKKPAKSAARVDEGIYIAPAEDAPEAPQKAAEAKPRKAAKRKAAKATKASAAKPAADFEPVKLPAVFHSPDGRGKLEITAAAVTYSQGLREVIFPARSAHYFARDYKAGERVIAAGSVGVKVGGKSLIFGPEAPAIVAAVRTAKAAADKAAKAAKAKGGAE